MNYNRTDPIASLATTPGISAISIIRVSGYDLKKIYQLITNKKSYKNRYAEYCNIFDLKKKIILDKSIVIYFEKPHSYTGEDIIEIHCHGGHIIAQSILNMLYNHNIKPAYPGEYSYRAFLNNKIDLVEAELISSLINTTSEYSQNIILDNFDNKLSKNISRINNKIISILSIIEHELDFSEEEIKFTSKKTILNEIKDIETTVNQYLKRKNLIKAINSGIDVVILGLPNAGKSSLFNTLIGYDRTIVSSEKGTTRDSVETKLLINQYPVNLIDTAGYFNANDDLNRKSINQSMKYAKNADIILYLDEYNPIKQFKNLELTCNNIIYCRSKQDKAIKEINNDGSLNISSKTNYGINNLFEQLSTVLLTDYKYDFNKDTIIVSDRQIKIFNQADLLLKDIKNLLQDNVGMDVIASYMHELTNLFNECLGKVSNNEVLESIFSNFCVGK